MTNNMRRHHVTEAVPYPWPFDGDLTLVNTALLVIDMQGDFCSEGGFLHTAGVDVSPMRACIKPIASLLNTFREREMTVIFTRVGYRPDLSDVPRTRRWFAERKGTAIGARGALGRGLVQGEEGWQVVPELEPLAGEIIIDKPGTSSFYATPLQHTLECLGIKNLVLTGVMADVCVHSTLREANDRGYECVLLSDCTAASQPENLASAMQQTQMQGGVFGCVASSNDVARKLSSL